MKKLLAVLAIALVVAAGLWIAVRVQLSRRSVTVPELLPKDTLLLVHAPDLQRARERWHESALYKIWTEPSIQEWLSRPLQRLPQGDLGRKPFEEFLQLGPTHLFLALMSVEKNEPKLAGGFHFETTPEKARRFLETREANWWPRSSEVKRESEIYGQHQIERLRISHLQLVNVYDGHWFFVSNDLPTLKAMLDRADRRTEKAAISLRQNEIFAAAMKHLPADYAAGVFIDPQPFVSMLLPLVSITGQSLAASQSQRLKSIRIIASALKFDHGKMRETDFLGMPRLGPENKLGRTLLSTTDANTFFYSASQVHWPDQILAPVATVANGFQALIGQLNAALSAHGIQSKDLGAAVGDELEIVGRWPAETQWPILLANLPVKDPTRARKLIDALTSVEIGGAAWIKTEVSEATFYTAQPFLGPIPFTVTLALSDKRLLAGTDRAAVQALVTQPGQTGGDLAKSQVFLEAEGAVPSANTAFHYIDTRLLFERANTVVRPLLVTAAAIYPTLSQAIDLAKLPPPAAITSHLSPIVMSQRYETDGYVSESVGPVTFREATIGIAAAVGMSLIHLNEAQTRFALPSHQGGAPAISTTVSPSPTPSPF